MINLDQTNPGWSDEDEAICDRIANKPLSDLVGRRDFDETLHARDDRGRFAVELAAHVDENHRGMGGFGRHSATHGVLKPFREHKHSKHGATIVPGGAIAMPHLVKDFDEDKHPRDEHGRWASDGGGETPLHQSYAGPPPGSKAALLAAAKKYAWLTDPKAPWPTTIPPGGKTIFDTPEIIAARNLAPQASFDMTADGVAKYTAELKDEQDAKGIAQDRQAEIVLGIPASAKSALVANPLADEMHARLADADIAKEIVAYGEGLTPTREPGSDGLAGVVHEASSAVTERYIRDSITRGDNLVIPKVGDNYDKMAAQIRTLKDAGYTVHVTLVDVNSQEGARRTVARYYTTGRFVDPARSILEVDSKPPSTYERLKQEGLADGFTRIDNNGLPGSQQVIEGTNPVTGAKGRGGTQEDQAQPLAALGGRRAPGGDAVRRLGAKYNDAHDERGRFASGDGGTASDGEPIRVSRDIEGTKTFAKIVDAMRATGEQVVGYVNGPAKSELAELMQTLPGNQDPALYALAKEKGFDAPPQFASAEKIDEMVKNGSPDLWRGDVKMEWADGLLHGDYHAGKGTYGDGIYFIGSDGSKGDRMGAAVNFAGGYAGGGGGITHATLSPDAKVVDYETIHAEATSHYNAVMAKDVSDRDPHDEAVRHMLYDDGRYAMAKGYDAIKVPGGRTSGDRNPFYVVLNRGALIAEDHVYPSTDRTIRDSELAQRILGAP